MNIIRNKNFDEERALYRLQDALVENCRFAGEADGESFLKESDRITVKDCYMDLRYPMWHTTDLTLLGCEMTERCRAALWYVRNARIENCRFGGIKALRECENILLKECAAVSPEFGWRCRRLRVEGGKIEAEYAFFECEDLTAEGLTLCGKYSFQYTKNALVTNCNCKTKDAFWHAENVTVKDCVLDGEYIGWYSKGLTLINCRIKGTQPFCYANGLTLVGCTMEDCDLAFEYSDVQADIRGGIVSVKNPLRGKIEADEIGEIILSNSKYETNAEIVRRKEQT